MAEQPQTPQLIVLHEGVFRPAKFRSFSEREDHYLGFDIQRGLALGEERINPVALQLVAAMYLGQRQFSDEITSFESRDSFDHRVHVTDGTLSGLVREACQVAQHFGVPYFSVATVIGPAREKPVPLGGEAVQEMLSPFYREKSGLVEEIKIKYDQPVKHDFVLHPTAQLYVPK